MYGLRPGAQYRIPYAPYWQTRTTGCTATLDFDKLYFCASLVTQLPARRFCYSGPISNWHTVCIVLVRPALISLAFAVSLPFLCLPIRLTTVYETKYHRDYRFFAVFFFLLFQSSLVFLKFFSERRVNC